jgi:hypothetical protein
MGRVVLQAMQRILGDARFQEVLLVANLEHLDKLPPFNLDKQFPFEWVAALQAGTEQVFGARTGRNLNLDIGRECLNTGLKDFDPVLGIADLPFRLMPLGTKFRVGLDVFMRLFNTFSDQVVRLSSDSTHFYWRIERCPVCWGRQSDGPCCQLAVGLLQESIFWGTGGRRYHVQEIECVASGAAHCVIAIEKRPTG